MDSMYDDDPWLDDDPAHRINPAHFPKSCFEPTPAAPRRPSLTRTLSAKFTPGAVVKETTGRKRMTRATLASGFDVSDVVANYLFDPVVWQEAFRAASTKEERAQLRLLVLGGTRAAARDEHYWVVTKEDRANAKRVPMVVHAHTLEYATMFDFEAEPEPALALREARYAGTAHFIYADVVDVGVFMKQEQKTDPLVLVFAHPTRLGGTGGGGSTSQEEAVLRRTNLMYLVNNEGAQRIRRDWTYALPKHGGLYVPNALVYRSNESTGFKFLQTPFRLSFLLAAAPENKPRDRPNTGAAFVADWKRRIDAVLGVALQKGHDSLVLGAWGCGELGNDVQQVATLFYEALTARFRGCFKHVVFSFLHDPEAFRVFCAVFGSPRMPVPTEVDTVVRLGAPKASIMSARRSKDKTAKDQKKPAKKSSPPKKNEQDDAQLSAALQRVTIDPRNPNIDPELFPVADFVAPAAPSRPPPVSALAPKMSSKAEPPPAQSDLDSSEEVITW